MGSAWPPDRLRIEAAVRCCGSNIARKSLRLHCSSAQLSIPWASRWQLACIDIKSQDFGIDLTRFHFLSRVFPPSEIIDSKGNGGLEATFGVGCFTVSLCSAWFVRAACACCCSAVRALPGIIFGLHRSPAHLAEASALISNRGALEQPIRL